MAFHVSKARFDELVDEALESLPEPFANFLQEVPLEVRDEASAQQRNSVRIRQNDLLLGLYVGRPRTQRNVEESGRMPDVIYIFQRAIEEVSMTELQLKAQVRKTVLHEIGHHFGLDERQLAELGYG
jgi:predicted Zn-dependent protease with MMP-like domain